MTTKPVLAVASPSDDVSAIATWDEIERALTTAEMYWLTSIQHGELHTVPVIGVWWEGGLTMCSPRSERKYANLKANPVCQVLTGCSRLSPGLDIVVHGLAEELPEMEDRLRYGRQMAEKYPEPWRFEGTEEDMWVFRLVPTHVRAFHRLDPITYTRWDFRNDNV